MKVNYYFKTNNDTFGFDIKLVCSKIFGNIFEMVFLNGCCNYAKNKMSDLINTLSSDPARQSDPGRYIKPSSTYPLTFSLLPAWSGPQNLLLPKKMRHCTGIRGLRAKTNCGGKSLQFFFTQLLTVFFARWMIRLCYEWRQGSGSTSSAEGRRSNPTSASAPSVPYRRQRATFPPEFFAPQQSRGSHSQGARGHSGSRRRGGLEQGSGTSSSVQAPTEVGQFPPPDLIDWTLQDPPRPSDTIERRGIRRPTES